MFINDNNDNTSRGRTGLRFYNHMFVNYLVGCPHWPEALTQWYTLSGQQGALSRGVLTEVTAAEEQEQCVDAARAAVCVRETEFHLPLWFLGEPPQQNPGLTGLLHGRAAARTSGRYRPVQHGGRWRGRREYPSVDL